LDDHYFSSANAILDTTSNRTLQEKYDLPFDRFDQVARYTYMAVLKPYRGLNLPLYLLLEARQLYVIPRGFTYTWLLFPADRAMSSTFCTTLGFSIQTPVVYGEQGRSRVLLRNEKSHEAHVADMQTRCFLDSRRPKALEVVPIFEATIAPEAGPEFSAGLRRWPQRYSRLVRDDEWVAH